MSGRSIGYFQIIPRSRRARKAIGDVRRRSKQFKKLVAAGDVDRAEAVSSGAWDALTSLFETLRNERDHHYLDDVELADPVGLLIQPASPQDQIDMVRRCKLDRSHPNCRPLSLREALNKLGHYNSDLSTYRLDGRGAHYLVLGGRQRTSNWMAEFLVSRLCDSAAKAAKAIRQFPRP